MELTTLSLNAYVAVKRMPDRIKALHILEALFYLKSDMQALWFYESSMP